MEPYGDGLPIGSTSHVHAIELGTSGGVFPWAATNDGVWHLTGTPLYLPALWRQSAP